MPSPGWILLLYALPAKHGAARVRLWRKLQRTGALALKTSAYLLPDRSDTVEVFQWLAQQIRDDGGEALVVRGAAIEGRAQEDFIQQFQNARAADYRGLLKKLAGVTAKSRRPATDIAVELEPLRRELEAIERIDYFGSPLLHDVRSRLQKLLTQDKRTEARLPRLRLGDFRKRLWLTRPRPQVDRVGSAWLIKRFIDPDARFIFATSPPRHPEAIPYDMIDVEFTHHGEDCTFETLLKRFGLGDRALRRIGELVHDADLGDGKFAASEGEGIDRMLRGLARQGWTDERILEHGFVSFDALYAQFRERGA